MNVAQREYKFRRDVDVMDREIINDDILWLCGAVKILGGPASTSTRRLFSSWKCNIRRCLVLAVTTRLSDLGLRQAAKQPALEL